MTCRRSSKHVLRAQDMERQYKSTGPRDEVADEGEPVLRSRRFRHCGDLVARIVDNVLGRLSILVKAMRPDHTEKAVLQHLPARSSAPRFPHRLHQFCAGAVITRVILGV
jgi:hypothetical protein